MKKQVTQKQRKQRQPLRKQHLNIGCDNLSEDRESPLLFLDLQEEIDKETVSTVENEVEATVESDVEETVETEANDEAETIEEGDTITEHVDLTQELSRLGLHSHLINIQQKTLAYTRTLLSRIARCLDWTYRLSNDNRPLRVNMLETWLRQLIQHDYILITAYVSYIVEFKFYFPATVLSHMDDLKATVGWYVLYKIGNQCVQSDLQGVSQTIATIRRLQSKKVSVHPRHIKNVFNFNVVGTDEKAEKHKVPVKFGGQSQPSRR